MNVEGLQTEPFNDGTVDGLYWQVVRKNDMHAFDNLPPKIRAYMQDNFSELPAEDILWDYRETYKGDEDATLAALISDNSAIKSMMLEQEGAMDIHG